MMKAEEALALANKYTDEHGGGGGGTSDYTQLTNKPQVNGVTLTGNKTSSDLGLMPEYEVDTTPTESSNNLITSGGVWSADNNINNKLQGSKTAGSTDGSPFEIPDYGMTESIQMYFKPTQDLHGYDKPWAGGAGKNKLTYPFTQTFPMTFNGVTITDDNGQLTINNKCTYGFNLILVGNSATVWGSVDNAKSLFVSDGNYTISGGDETAQIYINHYRNGALFETYTVGAQSITISVLSTDLFEVSVRINSYTTYNNLTLSPQIEPGQTATSYEPYSNICPISGQDNATFEWTGKNLFDKEQTFAYNGFISSDGTLTASEFWWTTDYQPIKSGTYTMSGISSEGSAYYGICWYDSNKTYIGGFQKFDTAPQTVTIPSNAKYIRYCVNAEAFNTFQLEQGSTATEYEPYTHGELPMNFGNTYYGGFCQFNGQIYPDWDYIASYNGETLSGEWVSDRDEYVAGTTPTIGAEVAYKTTPSYVKVTPPANLNLTDDYPIEYNGYMASINYQPKNTVLAEAKKYTNQAIAKLGLPQSPTTDGTYHLECSVSGGIPTITWVSNS